MLFCRYEAAEYAGNGDIKELEKVFQTMLPGLVNYSFGSRGGATCLLLAVKNGSLPTLALLLNKGADLYIPDEVSKTLYGTVSIS